MHAFVGAITVNIFDQRMDHHHHHHIKFRENSISFQFLT